MNNLLQLKGKFEQVKGKNPPGPPKLPKGTSVKAEQLESLLYDLKQLKMFWETDELLNGALVNIIYKGVVAKSNRAKGLLSKGNLKANKSVVGAKFIGNEKKKHVITHYVSMDILNDSIKKISACINKVKDEYDGIISSEDIEKINNKQVKYNSDLIAKTNFVSIIVDAHYIEKLAIPYEKENIKENCIVTIYKTDEKTAVLMEKLGIRLMPYRIIDETTMLLTPDQLEILKEKASYLISMAVSDISTLTKEDFFEIEKDILKLPRPSNEPIIGVIDTMFDKRVYFSEWVEFKNMLDDEIELTTNDYFHGTAVSSIIVDGPNINPNLDDGCGRFRVRHFGVATARNFSSFTILRAIKEIIASNKDIKVWNLSLGSVLEINPNFISAEAAILDRIQYENDVIFVVAGTNKVTGDNTVKAIGSPADSINSLVVNSVSFNNKPATYSRVGPVLSFFTKPDLSYYGGDEKEYIRVCGPLGEAAVKGTSFAAPWIARKMSYLIDVMGLSKEIAKALLIDSASGWSKVSVSSNILGYGVVPIRIEDIINSANDEIKFVISGISEAYNTYNYNIPVPVYKAKHPFIAKATLCYFPCCERNQGVDYTNTEFDISFGRLKENKIKPIDNNVQSSEDVHYLREESARALFRKWDNIKQVREVIKNSNKPKKVYETGLWGISIRTKERLEEKYGEGLKFGLVITLKEINGVNRIDEFIQQCSLRGWLVNKIDVDNRIDIYNLAEEEIEFDDI